MIHAEAVHQFTSDYRQQRTIERTHETVYTRRRNLLQLQAVLELGLVEVGGVGIAHDFRVKAKFRKDGERAAFKACRFFVVSRNDEYRSASRAENSSG